MQEAYPASSHLAPLGQALNAHAGAEQNSARAALLL